MSRMRKPSEAFMGHIAARMTTQRQAAATVASASTSSTLVEEIANVEAGIPTDYAETVQELRDRLDAIEAEMP